MKRALLVLILIVAFCQLLGDTFSIQGVLRDPLGKTVEDGYYSITFRICDDSTGGNIIWVEPLSSVQVSNGVFGVELGLISSLDNVPFDANYWIGMSVDGGIEMEPRFKMVKSTAAMSVYGSNNEFPSVGNVGIGTHEPQANLHIMETNNDQDKLLIQEEDGTPNLVITAAGKMGVNVANPEDALEINGNLRMHSDGIIKFGDGSQMTTANALSASSVSNNGNTLITADADVDGSGNLNLISGNTTRLQITPDAKLMIDAENVSLDTLGNLSVAENISCNTGNITNQLTAGNLDVRGEEVRIWDGTASVDYAIGTGDLYVENELEVDGNIRAPYIYLAGGVKAPYFQDGGYMVDPGGTSQFNFMCVGHQSDHVGQLDIRGDEVRIWNGTGGPSEATGAGDLYVQDDLEIGDDIFLGGWLRDPENTEVLLHPAGVSRLNELTIGCNDVGTNSIDGALDVRGDEVRIWTGSGTVDLATGNGDLYVQNELEVDGDVYVGDDLTVIDEFCCFDYFLTKEEPGGPRAWNFFCDYEYNLVFKLNGNTKSYIEHTNGEWMRVGRMAGEETIREENVLSKLVNLNVVRANYSSENGIEETSIGFIGEEVSEVYPALVSKKDGNYFMGAKEISVVAVAAIQELHEIVMEQAKLLADQEKINKDLMKRLEALENK